VQLKLNLVNPSIEDRPKLRQQAAAGFTLVEVVMATAILAMVFGTVLVAYTQSAHRAQWSGFSLAAQAMAVQQLEQARSGVWDPTDNPGKNELTNLTMIGWSYASGVWSGYTNVTLNLPVSGTNVMTATNYVSVRYVTNSTSPLVYVQMVRVDTVWPFYGHGTVHYYTNSVANYFAPENTTGL